MLRLSAKERTRNPFINSARGGRILSALQLPIFKLRPPASYGVLATTGRRSGKRRERCVRVVKRGDRAYLVAIKGPRTAWLKNVGAHPEVRLRVRGGTFTGIARELRAPEHTEAMDAYCESESTSPFEYMEYSMWRRDRPTPARIRELHRTWFETGTPLVVELRGA